MGASQRTKGARGEREVANILGEALGTEISRNWQKQFDGGAFDLVGLQGWAVEVKRAKQESISEWWRQAVAQAQAHGLKPALVYRIDGQGKGLDLDEKWQAIVPAYTVTTITDKEPTVRMNLKTWIYFLACDDPKL